MERKKKVLLTGAAGNIGTGFRNEYLRKYKKNYDLRLGVHNPKFRDKKFKDVVRIDLGDFETLKKACKAIDTVVHLAANPNFKAKFSEIIGPNIIGTYNMFEAARKAGCKRIVFASSVHAIMGYPVDFQAHSDDPPLSDDIYGASKIFGESLCSIFSQKHGMSCIAIRIGAYVSEVERCKLLYGDNPQLLDIAVTQRDLGQLIHKCIMASKDVRFAILSGLSNNRFKRMDLEQAKKLVGYKPKDDSFKISKELKFGKDVVV